MFPQDRNLHGKAFGGILMRLALFVRRLSSTKKKLTPQRAVLHQRRHLRLDPSALPIARSDHLQTASTHRCCLATIFKSGAHLEATRGPGRRGKGAYNGTGGGGRGGNGCEAYNKHLLLYARQGRPAADRADSRALVLRRSNGLSGRQAEAGGWERDAKVVSGRTGFLTMQYMCV